MLCEKISRSLDRARKKQLHDLAIPVVHHAHTPNLPPFWVMKFGSVGWVWNFHLRPAGKSRTATQYNCVSGVTRVLGRLIVQQGLSITAARVEVLDQGRIEE